MDNSYKKLRVSKLRDYLFGIVKELNKSIRGINVDALAKDINSYSLIRIPTDKNVSKWIDGGGIKRDVYSFRSRCLFSYNEINNLENVGFFEKFEDKIENNNKNGVLPSIDKIESIECLNTGTLIDVETTTGEFEIQIQITYRS